MSLLGASLLTLLAIVLLSVLRSRLLFEIMGLTLLLFKSSLMGKWFYTILFLPGTILHELSHWLMAELLGVRTGEIQILPDFADSSPAGREKLGSVATARSGPLRSFLIGVAPFLAGILILWLLGLLLQQGGWQIWQYVLIFYGVVVVGSSLLLSAEDRRSWPFILILGVVLTGLYLLLPYRFPPSFFARLTSLLVTLNQILYVTVGAILVIIGLSYLLRRIIEHILGKKIIRR